MAVLNKVDSNLTGLSYSEELTIGVLKTSPVFIPMEPNSYSDFGGELTTLARNPINPSRQRKFGVVVDLDASGGLNTDITQTNLQDILQGFFFANQRNKPQIKNAVGVDTITASIDAAGLITFVGANPSTTFTTQQLVFVTGFPTTANNGLYTVGALTATTMTLLTADGTKAAVVTVAESANAANYTVVGGPAPAAGSAISVVMVGYEFDTGDFDVTAGGGVFPTLNSAVDGFAALGIIPGEWIFVGGDAAITRLTNVDGNGNEVNSGFMRIRTIATNVLTVDKSPFTLTTEADTTQSVQVFSMRILKNELGADIIRRTYQLQRTLGRADTTDTNDQSEYLIGSVPSELTINFETADKLNVDLSFVSINNEQRTAAQAPKSTLTGAINVPLEEADAFNTSNDFSRVKLASVSDINSAPTALFAFATAFTITINNNVSPNKAIGCLGAFEVTVGTFEVGGDITAYFADIAAVQAVRNNAEITLDMQIVKANAGVTIDLPLISLGDGRVNIEQDTEITLPLTNQAATAAKVDPNMDYTLLIGFWDYLPTFADQDFC